MSMSQAEIEAAQYSARDRDFIATVGLNIMVEALSLKSGKWRAYLIDLVTPWSPRGQTAESKEVVRDNYGYIIITKSREELITRLKCEYPGWRWSP